VRVQDSGGPAPPPSRSPARVAVVVGLAALLLATVVGGWLAFRSHPPGNPSDDDGPALSQTRVAELGLPATVALSCGDRLGSGFFVDKELLITNAHVLCPGSSTLKVRFSDGREVEGTVVQSEDALDLAVVRARGLRASPLPLGDAGVLKVGERLTMIGSPVGMEFTVHQGSVSNVDRRDFGIAYIQIDAPVNPGNSGGPLIDERGHVVGVITMKRLDAEGIGLAVPINYLHTGASPLLPDLAGPRSAGFERMVQRAETDSDKMAVEFSTSEHRPGLIGATVSGGSSLMIEVLWPSPTEPGAHTFTFHFWNGDNRICSFEGEVGSWLKVEGKDGGSPYPPRIQGWLTRKNLSLDLYVGRARANFGGCPADELNPPIEMEMEGADPSANRAKFS
jgi:serine protease Do